MILDKALCYSQYTLYFSLEHSFNADTAVENNACQKIAPRFTFPGCVIQAPLQWLSRSALVAVLCYWHYDFATSEEENAPEGEK
jgi:hypothetical protein